MPFFSGFVASVYNYADEDEVNGKPQNTKDGQILCARQQDPKIGGAHRPASLVFRALDAGI